MKKYYLIMSKKTGKPVAYTYITGGESDYGTSGSDEELITKRVRIATENIVIENDDCYSGQLTNKVPEGLPMI